MEPQATHLEMYVYIWSDIKALQLCLVYNLVPAEDSLQGLQACRPRS